ncbi:MAG TPA: BTAD domain-containing putative transcriptional regulator, partial [Dongiaceae bacterium]
MAVLTIRLLGSFEARLGAGPPVDFPTKKARGLLAYLAARPAQAHSRDQIAELLWGARADEQARGSLRRTLSDLRKALPFADGEWLVSEGDTLMLDDSGIDVDLVRFERLAADGEPRALEQAVELYRGELLAGFGLHEQAFEEWLRTERERLRQLVLKTLTKLLTHYTATQALDRAIQTGTRLLALDPANEPAHRALMSLYARQGRRSEALRQYRLCSEALMRELGVRPDAATEALHRDFQREGAAVSDVATTSARQEPSYETPLPPDKPSIAVLPFANLSGDPEQEYFADGLVEDIIGALSRISALWVIARASTFSYKGKPIDVKQVARELGVRYVMEGSVRRSGERVRVTAQLADAVTGRPVWAEHYDRPLADLFDIQDEITRSVAATTETQIMLAEGQAIADAASRGLKTTDFKARDLVTRAWGRGFDQTPEAIEEASQLAEEAIRLDPTYPRAHFMRATVAFCRLWFGDIPHDQANLARAMELARTALKLAPRDELAHLAMAWAWAYAAGRLEEALAECERGLELNPNASLIHGNRGFFLAPLGRSSEAIEACRLALRLNPRDPSNFWRHHAIAVAHFAAEDYAAARNEAKKIALSRPVLQSALIWAAAAAAQDDFADARTAVANCLALRPDLTVGSVIPRFM